jgi:predicted amidophosphoribosyltransferase
MLSEKSNSATPFCKVCFHTMGTYSWRRLFGEEVPLCGHCLRQMDPKMRYWKVEGIEACSLYSYNGMVRDLLYQFKGCGDIELAPVFLAYQAPLLRFLYHGYTLVPAPSFEAKNEARGFNHVELMFSSLHLPLLHALRKLDDVKQANLHFDDRQKIGQHLARNEGVSIAGKKILFVDDLFTTGATAKACCHLLQKGHPSRLKILVMGYTPEKTLAELRNEPP